MLLRLPAMGGGASKKAQGPALGDVILLRSYDVIGSVVKLEPSTRKGGKDKVTLVQVGPGGGLAMGEQELSVGFRRFSGRLNNRRVAYRRPISCFKL